VPKNKKNINFIMRRTYLGRRKMPRTKLLPSGKILPISKFLLSSMRLPCTKFLLIQEVNQQIKGKRK
jgi:hypothetical protein